MSSQTGAERQLRPDLKRPEGWELIDRRSLGPFLTGATYRLPGGTEVNWTSRRHRKGLDQRVGDEHRRSRRRWGFAPRSRNWWIGVLFMGGASLFALGSLPAYTRQVGHHAGLITLAIGSVLFTSAAYLQFSQAINAPRAVSDVYLDPPSWLHVFTVEPRRIDWWSTLVQFVGTLLFNVSTFGALIRALGTSGRDVVVWIPTMGGSVCFLAASYLAIIEVCQRPFCRRATAEWWIVMINMGGSVLFMASALGALVLPDGEVLAGDVVMVGTFLGAVCFFIGALLLLPESAETGEPSAATAPVG